MSEGNGSIRCVEPDDVGCSNAQDHICCADLRNDMGHTVFNELSQCLLVWNKIGIRILAARTSLEVVWVSPQSRHS